MPVARQTVLLSAAIPLAASFVVLDAAGVSSRIWMTHIVLIGCAGLLMGVGQLLDRVVSSEIAAKSIALLTLIGVAAPLFAASFGPQRWIAIGPLSLYVAPVLLPALLATCSPSVRRRGKHEIVAVVIVVGVAALLAVQPDAAQTLALSVAAIVLLLRYRSSARVLLGAALALSLVTALAFSRPDPLEAVPHVEGVFALALGRSLPIGIAVITSAVAMIAALVAGSLRGPAWLMAVAAYCATLFICSVAGSTPAPLIGFGAGPLLGFALLATVSAWFEADPP